jgi:AhpD family alkylhydroperoxidase
MRFAILFLLISPWSAARAADSAQPKSIPLTRPDMKIALDELKKRTPRLPMPVLTAEEKEKLGDRKLVNNGRMRAYYLAPELRGESFRERDPNLTLNSTTKTKFFWIVSRMNNCQYCLGHQESKLSSAGVDDDGLAALDGDWSDMTPELRAAFVLTRKLTAKPHEITKADIDAVKKHYKDRQVLEIIFTIAGNNAMNRWTDAIGIPQEEHRVYKTPTSKEYQTKTTKVAPFALDDGKPTTKAAYPARPALETRAQVETALAACRKRKAHFDLVEEAETRKLLTGDWPRGTLPAYVRLLAHFPKHGLARANGLRAAEDKGVLDRTLRAQVAWIAARHDRAWYALGHARKRLLALGVKEPDIYALDGDLKGYTSAQRAAFGVASKLTTTPALISDADIAGLREHYKDKEVAELVYHVTLAAFFNRLTEAAGLALED